MATKIQKTSVLVARSWGSPDITITVTPADIGISMSLEDFLHALALEAGNPSFLFTVAGLEARLKAAAETVVEGMKSETARVM